MEADEKVVLGVKRLPDGGQHTAGEPVMLLEERRVKAESGRKPVLFCGRVGHHSLPPTTTTQSEVTHAENVLGLHNSAQRLDLTHSF